MTDREIPTETPAAFDLLQTSLTIAFQESENGAGAIELARSLLHGYFKDRGRGGLISFNSELSGEEKLPLAKLPEPICSEVLGLVRGKPLSAEAGEYLRRHFEQGRALVHCILAAQRQAATYAELRSIC